MAGALPSPRFYAHFSGLLESRLLRLSAAHFPSLARRSRRRSRIGNALLHPQHAPWADPKPFGYKVPAPPAYLDEYRRACDIPKPVAYRVPPPSLEMGTAPG